MSGVYIPKKRQAPFIPRPPSPDWAGIINHLLRKGCRKVGIVAACDLSREKIYGILNGRYEPTYSEAMRLMALRDHPELKQ